MLSKRATRQILTASFIFSISTFTQILYLPDTAAHTCLDITIIVLPRSPSPRSSAIFSSTFYDSGVCALANIGGACAACDSHRVLCRQKVRSSLWVIFPFRMGISTAVEPHCCVYLRWLRLRTPRMFSTFLFYFSEYLKLFGFNAVRSYF